jgi:hypothetical protein
MSRWHGDAPGVLARGAGESSGRVPGPASVSVVDLDHVGIPCPVGARLYPGHPFEHKLQEGASVGPGVANGTGGLRWFPFDGILENRAQRWLSRRAQARRRWPLGSWHVRPRPTPKDRRRAPTVAPRSGQSRAPTRARTPPATQATSRPRVAPPCPASASRPRFAAPVPPACPLPRASARSARPETPATPCVSCRASHALRPSPAAAAPATAARARPTCVSDSSARTRTRFSEGYDSGLPGGCIGRGH